LIIKDGDEKPSQQDIVLLLADFSFTPPNQIFAQLRSRQTGDMDMPGKGRGRGNKKQTRFE
jgi:hypothetical protein